MIERAPGTCPLCLTHPLRQIGPQLWDCTSRRCNSQFYIDEHNLLAVRDRIPFREVARFGRKPQPRCTQEQASNALAAIVFAVLAVLSFASSLWWNVPVLALAAFLFLVTAAIFSRYA